MANKYTTLEQLTSVMNALAGKIKAKDYEQKANLKALAYKDEIAKSDLSTALQDEIDAMADEATVTQQINSQIAAVYKPGGSKVAADLVNAPTAAQLGYVYNVTEDFTTNVNFLEGADQAFPAGTDVGVIEIPNSVYSAVTPEGTEDPSAEGWYVEDSGNAGQYVSATDTTVVSGTTYYELVAGYKWNVMAGFIDQTQFADADEFAAVKAVVDGLETATDPEIQAIIDGIDLEEGTVTPAPNGDNLGY